MSVTYSETYITVRGTRCVVSANGSPHPAVSGHWAKSTGSSTGPGRFPLSGSVQAKNSQWLPHGGLPQRIQMSAVSPSAQRPGPDIGVCHTYTGERRVPAWRRGHQHVGAVRGGFSWARPGTEHPEFVQASSLPKAEWGKGLENPCPQGLPALDP